MSTLSINLSLSLAIPFSLLIVFITPVSYPRSTIHIAFKLVFDCLIYYHYLHTHLLSGQAVRVRTLYLTELNYLI